MAVAPLPVVRAVVVRVVYAGRPGDLARLARTADEGTRRGGAHGESVDPAALALDGDDSLETVSARESGETGQAVGAMEGAGVGAGTDTEAARSRGSAAVELVRSEVRVAEDVVAAGCPRAAGGAGSGGSASGGAGAAGAGGGDGGGSGVGGSRPEKQLRLQVGRNSMLFWVCVFVLLERKRKENETEIYSGVEIYV